MDGQFWQCATFARMFSGLQLFGAAAGWWSQAVGRYTRGGAPAVGAVMVFKAIGSMRSGHVATVSQVVSDRIVKVTHANWSVRGQIERDVEVMDTSAQGDWSSVRVWFRGLHDLGQRNYPVYGFIYGGKADAPPPAQVKPRLVAAQSATPAPVTAAPGLATDLLARAAPLALTADASSSTLRLAALAG
ncbi:CHAP domain-containing protein [Sphingomonas sp.]|uniref:CHAP domain-containing protein n=1 Tax=Sphingomonas sp. TaxID=28214 RepID=UPI003AFF82A6